MSENERIDEAAVVRKAERIAEMRAKIADLQERYDNAISEPAANAWLGMLIDAQDYLEDIEKGNAE